MRAGHSLDHAGEEHDVRCLPGGQVLVAGQPVGRTDMRALRERHGFRGSGEQLHELPGWHRCRGRGKHVHRLPRWQFWGGPGQLLWRLCGRDVLD